MWEQQKEAFSILTGNPNNDLKTLATVCYVLKQSVVCQYKFYTPQEIHGKYFV